MLTEGSPEEDLAPYDTQDIVIAIAGSQRDGTVGTEAMSAAQRIKAQVKSSPSFPSALDLKANRIHTQRS